MSKYIKNNIGSFIVFILSFLISTSSQAWYGGAVSVGFGGGNVHYHGQQDIQVYNPGGYGYYGRDRGYYYGGGPIIVPNIIITPPAPRYYVPQCEQVEVCDSYGECWLEQMCR